MKNRLDSGDALYSSVQNILFSPVLSKNVKVKLVRENFKLPVFFCIGVKLDL
jgi:hypothetical protein